MSREERQRRTAADDRDFWWIGEKKSEHDIGEGRKGGGISEAQLREFSKQFDTVSFM